MQLILSFLIITTLGFAMQTCSKTSTKLPANAAPASNANATTVAATTPQDEAPRITLAEAKADYDAGKAIIVDARPAESYKVEHIKNSINIPLGDFEAEYKNIPTNKKIIVYCS